MSHRRLRGLLPLLAVLSLPLSACSGGSTSATTQPGDGSPARASSSAAAPSAKPTDLAQISTDLPLQPGTYAVPFLQAGRHVRAIIDVPDGYFAWAGGGVIGDNAGAGDVAFWGRVDRVDTDPCLDGRRVSSGTSVHDLAALLVAQRHVTTSRPAPARIGGYRGLYVTVTAPAHLDRCRGHRVTLWGNAGETWLQSDEPGAVFHAWILDVHGQRVVAGARISSDARAGQAAALTSIVEAARFGVPPRRS